MKRLTEIGFCTMDYSDAPELDEVAGDGPFHLEDLGQAWYVALNGVRFTACAERLPWPLLRDELVDALRERRWPCLYRIRLRANEVEPGAGPIRVTLDGRQVYADRADRLLGWTP